MPGCALPKYLDPYREDARSICGGPSRCISSSSGRRQSACGRPRGPSRKTSSRRLPKRASNGSPRTKRSSPNSTNGLISRDGQGHMRHPEMLYRPWRVESGDKSLHVIFRDHALSDLIGFHYQRSDPEHAAWDMISKFLAIGRAVESNNAGRGALVPVILDGENCWEYYPDGASVFSVRSIAIASRIRRFARSASATISKTSRPPIASALSLPAAGSRTTSPSGSAITKTIRRGTCCTRPCEFLKQTEAEGKCRRKGWPRPGKKCSSLKEATGTGGSATIIRHHRTHSSTSCSASICKTSTRCSTRCRRMCSSTRSSGCSGARTPSRPASAR